MTGSSISNCIGPSTRSATPIRPPALDLHGGVAEPDGSRDGSRATNCGLPGRLADRRQGGRRARSGHERAGVYSDRNRRRLPAAAGSASQPAGCLEHSTRRCSMSGTSSSRTRAAARSSWVRPNGRTSSWTSPILRAIP